MTISKNDEPDQRPAEQNVQRRVQSGFADPSGQYPKREYFYEPSTNKAARGASRNELSIGGGFDGISVDLPPQQSSRYGYNDVKETLSGHVVEYDDTPGGERILIKHRSGSGVELRADGSIVMKTENNRVESVSGSSALIVEGDGELRYNGNLNLKVAGDLNIDVGGDINTTVGGTKKETVNGSSRETVYGTKGSIVKGSRSNTTVGTQTDTSLGGKNDIVKGSYRQSVDGTAIQAVSGSFKQTSEGEMILSTPNMNIGASNLSVFGASGTIGGAGMVHYGVTYYGTTFHGDLNGTADKAVTADVTNSQNYPSDETGTAQGYSVSNDGTSSASASSSLMSSYLDQSANGVVKVKVDFDEGLKNLIDRSSANGGLSDRNLSTREVRSKLRDPANQENTDFIGNSVSTGTLSSNYAKPVPAGIGRVSGSTASVRVPSVPIRGKTTEVTRFRPNKNKNVSKFVPLPAYNPNLLPEGTPINGKVELAPGVRLARFLGGTGDRTTLAHLPTREERLAVARQLHMHADAMQTVLRDRGQFKDYRLVVVEGLYKPGPEETVTPDSINDWATKGRAVVYELHDSRGRPDLRKTYDLAVYWKDSINFEKLILSYDTFDPSGDVAGQIILVMPEVDENYNISGGRYSNLTETLYNNKLQGKELIEINEA